MSVNNGNLRKIPLESILNLNTFENEIDSSFSTYKKLNSPRYGGVLSNLYKKDIDLGDKTFITVDKDNNVWSYLYNSSSAKYNIYKNNEVFSSIGKKSYTKQKGSVMVALMAIGFSESQAEVFSSYDQVFFKRVEDYIVLATRNKSDTSYRYTLYVFEVENGVATRLGYKTNLYIPSTWINDFGDFFISAVHIDNYLFINLLPYCENASFTTLIPGRTVNTNTAFNLTTNVFESSSKFKFSSIDDTTNENIQYPDFTNINSVQSDLSGFSTLTTINFTLKDMLIIDDKFMVLSNAHDIVLIGGKEVTVTEISGSYVYLPCQVCQLNTKRLTDVPYNSGIIDDIDGYGAINAYRADVLVKSDIPCITVQSVKEKHRTVSLDPCHFSICASDDMQTLFYGNYDSTKTVNQWLNTVEYVESTSETYKHEILLNVDGELQNIDDYNLNWEVTFAPRNKNVSVTDEEDWFFRYFNRAKVNYNERSNVLYGKTGYYTMVDSTLTLTDYSFPVLGTPRLRTESVAGVSDNEYTGSGTAIIAEGQKVGFAKNTLSSFIAEELSFTVCYFGGYFFSVGIDCTTIQNNTVLDRVVTYFQDNIILLNTDGEYVIYTINNSSDLDFTVIDNRYIFFKIVDTWNAIDTKKSKKWNYALDFNNRIAMSTTLSHSIIVDNSCVLYNNLYLFDAYKTEHSKAEDLTDYINTFVFTSNINNNYLITNEPYISNQVAPFIVKGLKITKSIFSYNYSQIRNTYSFFEIYTYSYFKSEPTNDEEDYKDYLIDAYSTFSDSEILSAITYWFSLIHNNPLIEQGTVYALGTNVYYSPVLDSEIYNSSMNTYFTQIGSKSFQLLTNGDTKEPILLYGLMTLTSLANIFCIQGAFYGYDEDYLYYVTYSDQTIKSFDIICPINGMEFIGNNLYTAYFYSKTNRSIYSFIGANTLTLLYECNRIKDIYSIFYLTSTQDIFICTNDGLFKLSSNNSIIRITEEEISEIGKYGNQFYTLTDNNELTLYSLNYVEDYDKLPIELETEYFGSDDFSVNEFDTVYVRLARNIEDSNLVGNVIFESNILTQINKKNDKKVVKIDVSEWDKDTSTMLIRYQPKYQQGIGFSLGIKSDFPISAIYINSTPLAITNSKNNI